MIRKRLGRLATAILSASLLGAVVFAAPASAGNPTWDIVITPVPAKVGVGHDAGFIVKVVNNGPSNINDLRVIVTPTDTPDAAPTYVSDLVYRIDDVLTGEVTACAPAGVPLTCLLGTLEDDESVTFTVAYLVPVGTAGQFDLDVAIRAGTGDPDGKNNSRGDKYAEQAAAVIGTGNFDGGFVVGADTYQTNPTLRNNNIQSTGLSGAPQLVPVTLQDGIDALAACDSALDDPQCAQLFGEWSELHVNNGNGGHPFANAFKVTLVVRGSAVPGGTAEGDVVVVHVLDNGTIDIIGDADSETCVFAGTATYPSNPQCLSVHKAGNNWVIDVWLFDNGNIRGGW